MLGIYLLPWLVLLLLIVLGVIVSVRTFGQLLKRNHTPEMFNTIFSIRRFLRQIKEEKLLIDETMSA
jgi:hypothetical protein